MGIEAIGWNEGSEEPLATAHGHPKHHGKSPSWLGHFLCLIRLAPSSILPSVETQHCLDIYHGTAMEGKHCS